MAVEGFEFLDLGVVDGVGEVVAVDAFDVGFAALIIELFDVVLAGFVQVDGFGVKGRKGCWKSHVGDDLVVSGGVDDDEVVAGDAAEADGVGGVGVGGPVPGFGGVVDEAEFLKKFEHFGGVVGSEEFVVAEGEFEDGALEVAEDDLEVVGVDIGVFGGAVEEVLGVLDDVLVEGALDATSTATESS